MNSFYAPHVDKTVHTSDGRVFAYGPRITRGGTFGELSTPSLPSLARLPTTGKSVGWTTTTTRVTTSTAGLPTARSKHTRSCLQRC
ncbi:hypothetical protein XAC3810_210009 [Xanthomonas citri pv. citri]|uniref:Uncharacterized protein n=1 Tax=Xanthomonas citri pv. citri TaxID=611301 RepID=A0A0U5BPQ6_XANCI|nr:hypothetical protein XAC9322_190007 [Xanthomonas citri pv. citri]CEE19283.1 hypothetical protein XAC3824_180009 [Xanthomonas citri pv. citri]CEE20275.1 hypothetical protein XAC1083_190009 [Xanthomonas citri pv. citri]CEE28535.1 hypothetical protein XAC3810_210009 [Xanthomonas citri pv. citri]CEE30475.1 hypothetical protein XAC902_210007 [Xanthomonas citri pv. citri]